MDRLDGGEVLLHFYCILEETVWEVWSICKEEVWRLSSFPLLLFSGRWTVVDVGVHSGVGGRLDMGRGCRGSLHQRSTLYIYSEMKEVKSKFRCLRYLCTW